MDRLLTGGEVARLFSVDPKTVTLWARSGRLPVALVTLGGHRRYRESVVRALLTGEEHGDGVRQS